MTDARIVATNPADSSVVPVACNENGELLLAETSLDQFVEKNGDTMTGNLHMGDKIILNPDGSAQFAGGAVDFYDTGRVALSKRVTIGGSSVPASDEVFNIYSANGELVRVLGNGGTKFTGNIEVPFSYLTTVPIDPTRYPTPSGITSQSHLCVGGKQTWVQFSGSYNAGAGTAGYIHFCPSFRNRGENSGMYFGGVARTANWTEIVMGSVTAAVGEGNATIAETIAFGPNGTARFDSDVIVGSRGKQWMLVESGGLCHLVEQTRSAEIDTADLVDPPSYPELRNLPQEIDQLRSVVTALLTEVQRVEEKLRMAPESGWPVWDGSD